MNDLAERELITLAKSIFNIKEITDIAPLFDERLSIDIVMETGEINRSRYRWVSFLMDHKIIKGVSIGVKAKALEKDSVQLYQELFHEVNNQITGAILGIEQSLTKEKVEDIRESVLEELENLRRISGIAKTIIAMTKGEPVTGICNVKKVIKETIESFRKALPEKIKIKTILPEGNWIADIYYDALFQILTNLLLNSVEAIGSSGEVLIYVQGAGNIVRIDVEDTGCGIDKEDLPNIFKPFFSKRKGGTGLGLFIVKNLIELYKGKIEVKSRRGAGTTFTILLKGKKEG